MNKQKITLVISIAALIGLSAFGFYVVRDRADLAEKLARETTRSELLERKYKEMKQQAENLLRVKSGLEGQQRVKQAEAQKQVEEMQTKLKAMQCKLGESDTCVQSLTEQQAALKQTLAELQALQHKTRTELDETSEAKSMLERSEASLKKQLIRTEAHLARARAQNAELCLLANKLVDEYKNKGVMSAVAAKEPLTQIGRARLEETTQNYKEEIDSLKLAQKKK